MQQALSKEARLKSDPQTDRHRHHRHRVAETKRQTHICRERKFQNARETENHTYVGIYGTFSNLKSWPQWHISLNKDIPPKSPQTVTNWELGLKMPEIYETSYPKYHRCVLQRMTLPNNAV